MTRREIFLVAHELNHWRQIKSRCNNPNDKDFYKYGGRGIKLCDEWFLYPDGFLNFFEHVSQLPHFGESGYTLDRINNDGNYEPGNVRWATYKEQTANRRCVRKDHGQLLREIAEEENLPMLAVEKRWREGDRGDRLRRPLRTKKDAYSNELTRPKKSI